MPTDPTRNGSTSDAPESSSGSASDTPSGDSATPSSAESEENAPPSIAASERETPKNEIPDNVTSKKPGKQDNHPDGPAFDNRDADAGSSDHVESEEGGPEKGGREEGMYGEDEPGEEKLLQDDGPATLGELKEPQRLHPLTLVQQLIASLPALVLLLFPVFSNPNSQNVVYLFMTLAYGVIALPAILLQYYRFSYRLTEKQIIIQSGVFNRKNRSIPIERVQNVQIEQNLLARVANIAKVKIETAGSTGTEGVLEYVSLREAHRIRQVIRSFQRQRVGDPSKENASDEVHRTSESHRSPSSDASSVDANDDATGIDADEGKETATGSQSDGDRPAVRSGSRDARVRKYAPATSEETRELFEMPLERVLLSGMFRFSLVYIAVVFSIFQFVEPDTLLNYVMASRSQVQSLFDTIYDSPALAAAVTIIFASFFGWLTGILINLTRYYNFHLWLDGDKLRKRHGLFTVREGTIPLEKVQALIIRTNPLMEAFGWYALEAQTVGIDVDQQGHRVVVPFAQREDVLEIGRYVRSFSLPDAFESVSPLTVRRSFARYMMGLVALVAPAAYFYPETWLHPLDVALPYWAFSIAPFLLGWAYLQYRRHGYSMASDALYIRRGVIGRYIWILPTEKQHVYYATASIFQRRLGLKSFFVDTAGAGGFAYPEVVDVPAEIADDAFDHVYDQFETLYENRIRAATGSANTRLSAEERPQLPREMRERQDD